MILLLILLAAAALKSLFFFSYHSTDFEVHRNWIALTHSLPPSKWYFESTSKWTLDYPPFFAWFQWILSHVAVQLDPEMVAIRALPYVSFRTVVFMRFTVLISEFVLFYSLWRLTNAFAKHCGNHISRRRLPLACVLFAFNYGLLIVDHIHFQYNGLLFGILFISGSLLIEGRFILAALCFTALLNLKHTFLYIAPAYFIYLMFNYCLASTDRHYSGVVAKLFKIGTAVLTVVALSFAPYFSQSHLNQIYLRLFPFGRGLTHTYWAPNAWAVYNFIEKVLCSINSRFHFQPSADTVNGSLTTGILDDNRYAMLPSVTPLCTAILSLSAMLANLLQCARKSLAFDVSHSQSLGTAYLKVVVGASWASFLFGWHVHEKAVLMFLLPLNVLALVDPKFSAVTFYATTLGHYSLIPLIPTRAETPVIISMFLAYTSVHWLALFRMQSNYDGPNTPKAKTAVKSHGFVRTIACIHLWALIPMYISCFIIWPLSSLQHRLPFFPLMATSVYTAVGLLSAFCYFVSQCFVRTNTQNVQTAVVTNELKRKRKPHERKVKVQ